MNEQPQIPDPAKKLTFTERVASWMELEAITQIFQYGKGVITTTLTGMFGVPGAIAAGIGLIVAGTAKTLSNKKSQKKNLLNLYRDEIASLLHKDPKSLTLDDLETTANISANGEKNAIGHELDAINKNTTIMLAVGITSTALIATGSAIASAFIPPNILQNLFSSAVSGVVGKGVHYVVNAGVTAYTGHRETYNVNREINAAVQDLKLHPMTPERVLGIMMEADPKLQAAIKQRFTENYYNMTIMQKAEVVNAFPQMHAKELAAAINAQVIKPTALGFIAYHQKPGYTHEPKPTLSVNFPAEKVALGKHTGNILSEDLSATRILH